MSMKALLSFFIVILEFTSAENSEDRSQSQLSRSQLSRVQIQKGNVTRFHVLTDVQRKLILDKHNELRRIVDPPAADMLKMSWDKRLEWMATNYSRECIWAHSKNRKLDGYPRFYWFGENLLIMKRLQFKDSFVANSVTAWHNEKYDYDYNTMQCKPNRLCGHYTQVAWATSVKVGCGLSTCDEAHGQGKTYKDATIFACNYAPGGNRVGNRMYKQGTPCSQCPAGYWCDDGLCTNEQRNSGADSGFLSKSLMAITCVFHSVVLCYVL